MSGRSAKDVDNVAFFLSANWEYPNPPSPALEGVVADWWRGDATVSVRGRSGILGASVEVRAALGGVADVLRAAEPSQTKSPLVSVDALLMRFVKQTEFVRNMVRVEAVSVQVVYLERAHGAGWEGHVRISAESLAALAAVGASLEFFAYERS